MATPDGGVSMMRPGRPLIIAMLVVVASFALAIVYPGLLLRPATDRALDVIENAVPSIERLSAAGAELTFLGADVTRYVDGIQNGDPVTRKDIEALRQRLATELASYRTLPSFPEEAHRLAAIDRGLALLDASITMTLDQADAGSKETANRTLEETFRPRLNDSRRAIEQLKMLNASRIRSAAENILELKRGATLFAITWGVASVLIAVLATVLVFRILRARAGLMSDHAQLLADRATELEAFAGRVAHDLKSPLGAMALWVSAARGRDLDQKLGEPLDRLARQTDRMNRIIDGLLEFARAGGKPVPGAQVDVREALEVLVPEFSAAAVSAGAELRIDSFPAVRLACTSGALTSILSNLLGNALKYVAEGKHVPRRIAVHFREREGIARLEVEDNGPGLPAGSETLVFEPFRRLGASKQPGIGLGLATVKKIVEAYGGRVGVISKPGDGCLFWFEIPTFTGAARRPPPTDSRTRPGPGLAGAVA
jgi:signal transduction histidine kinase